MTVPGDSAAPCDDTGNPFATRWVRPGALPFLFSQQDNTIRVLERLRANGWWGQIIGPHGSGKSTLLQTLLSEFTRFERHAAFYSLAGNQRRLHIDREQVMAWTPATQVVVDGYEQLGFWSRQRLKRQCRRAGAGLLVTAHGDAGLPLLFQTTATLETAERLVSQLLSHRPGLITAEEIARRFDKHGGNVRELLFDLYDLIEQRR